MGTRGLATSSLLASIFSSPQRNIELLASKMSSSTESEGSSRISITEVLNGTEGAGNVKGHFVIDTMTGELPWRLVNGN